MKEHQALTRGSVLVGYADFIARYEKDPRSLLEAVGLSPVYLEQPDLYFPFSLLVELFELTAGEIHNPLFGLELGMAQGLDLIGPTAHLLLCNATFGNALKDMARYFRLQSSGSLLNLQRCGSTTFVDYEMLEAYKVGSRQRTEHVIGAGVEIMKTLLGRNWAPQAIHLQHAAFVDRRRYRRQLGCTPEFNAERTGILVATSDLSRPLADANPSLYTLVEGQLKMMQREFREDLKGQVFGLIRYAMPSGDVSLASIANLAAMSTRTLQRNLRSLGTSFQALVDEARRDVAEHYLRNTKLQMTQISDLLAFSSLSNFTHAFQRWHGTSPTDWRRTVVNGAPTGE